MKKNKLILLKNNPQQPQHDEEDFQTIGEINEALTKIEDNYSVFTPDIQVFEQMVVAEQNRQKKKFRRELTAFILIALLVITGLITAMFQLPIAFVTIQGVATVSLPIYVYLQYKKKEMHI